MFTIVIKKFGQFGVTESVTDNLNSARMFAREDFRKADVKSVMIINEADKVFLNLWKSDSEEGMITKCSK